MEIQQLRYFLAAANHSSFARAAGQCFTSRQNIAHSVNALERELNLPLFERRGNSVVVTPAGQEVAGRVDEILSRVDALQALSVGQVPAEAGLRAAVTYNLLARVPEKVESYLYQFDRGIKLLEVGCEDCYHAICADEADVGLALCMQRDFPECGFEEVNRLKAYVLVNEMSPPGSKVAALRLRLEGSAYSAYVGVVLSIRASFLPTRFPGLRFLQPVHRGDRLGALWDKAQRGSGHRDELLCGEPSRGHARRPVRRYPVRLVHLRLVSEAVELLCNHHAIRSRT